MVFKEYEICRHDRYIRKFELTKVFVENHSECMRNFCIGIILFSSHSNHVFLVLFQISRGTVRARPMAK